MAAKKGPRSNPPEIVTRRALWAAAEQQYKETEQAKDYLKSTGDYSGVKPRRWTTTP